MVPFYGGMDWSKQWNQPPTYGVPSEPSWMSLWPVRSQLVGQDITAANAWLLPVQWDIPDPGAGNSGYRKLVGVTRDQGGNIVPNVPVGAYNVTTGSLEASATSDSAGNYVLWVRTSNNYFVAGFLAGSPDRQGTTDNNLTGS